jgi:hypothetical protein
METKHQTEVINAVRIRANSAVSDIIFNYDPNAITDDSLERLEAVQTVLSGIGVHMGIDEIRQEFNARL